MRRPKHAFATILLGLQSPAVLLMEPFYFKESREKAGLMVAEFRIGTDWCNGCCAGFWVKLARVTIQLLATACNGVPHLWAHWAAFGGNLLLCLLEFVAMFR